jgi:hypothetical protein
VSIRGKEIELQLLGWGESHNSGCKVTFAVHPEDLEYFKNKTERKGKIAGQIFMAVLVEVDEVPQKPDPIAGPTVLVPEDFNGMAHKVGQTHKGHFPDGLCGLAVRWSLDADFISWCHDTLSADVTDSDGAAALIKRLCGVESRKQLDTAPGADMFFRKHFLEPYAASRRERGIEG